MTEKKKLLSADAELMRALGITDDDLAANEAGQVTQRQREVVEEYDFYQKIGQLFMGGIFGIIGVIALIAAMLELTRPGELGADLGFMLFGAIFVVIAFGMIRSRSHKRHTIAMDVLENRVGTMQGIAVVTQRDDNTPGYLEVNDQRFEVGDEVLKRIRHLEPYLIYFLQESKVVIAMQHMDSEDDNIKDEAANRLQDDDDQRQGRASQAGS